MSVVGTPPIRGFVFSCTYKTREECLRRKLIGETRVYGPVVIRVRKGDLLFLNDLSSDVLYGVFKATSDGGFKLEPEAFGGKYPYQVKFEPLGEVIKIGNAKRILQKFGARENKPLVGRKLLEFLDLFLPKPTLLNFHAGPTTDSSRLILEEKNKIQESMDEAYEEEIPLIEATTLWDFPKQSYGLTPKGDNKYPGVTPALVIYNLIWRYTDPGDLVVDPMAGSGTTLDVCREEKRRCICYDIAPPRPDVIQNDSRKIPLEDNSVDMIFVDSPYGDNIRYNDHPDCIGKISSETEKFYDELEKVMRECHRILKEGKILGWLIGDQWVKGRFTPVGLKVFQRLCKYFEPVDIVCVVRRGQISHRGPWYTRARKFNFFLRGFKYLFIMRKQSSKPREEVPRKINWTYYPRR